MYDVVLLLRTHTHTFCTTVFHLDITAVHLDVSTVEVTLFCMNEIEISVGRLQLRAGVPHFRCA